MAIRSPSTARGAHWAAAYIGRPYVPGAFDCGDLLELVTREVFGRAVPVPRDRPASRRSAGYQAVIARGLADLAQRVEVPAEGDIVQMVGAGRPNHVGVAVLLGGEVWVLHAAIRARQVVLHRVRDLESHGLAVEGFYRWI